MFPFVTILSTVFDAYIIIYIVFHIFGKICSKSSAAHVLPLEKGSIRSSISYVKISSSADEIFKTL